MNKTDKKKWRTLAVMILLIFTCSGCGNRHPEMKEALHVGVVTYTQGDPFINAISVLLMVILKSMVTEDMIIIVSVIASTTIRLPRITLYEWILYIVLIFGGAGLLARALFGGRK